MFGVYDEATGLSLRGTFIINPEGKLFKKGQIPMETFPFCHDFALSDKYAIFYLGSIVFGNMLPFILGTKTISDGPSTVA